MLDLRNNSFSSPIKLDFTELSELVVLDFASNFLDGTNLIKSYILQVVNIDAILK